MSPIDERLKSLNIVLPDVPAHRPQRPDPPWLKGSGPLARADPGWASAISHVHGNFHAEAKIGRLRSFPFHFQSPFIQEVTEYLAV
jgi:hypothetical protein